MLRAGLLTSEQLSAIFLNVEELLEHNLVLAEKLKDSVELAQVKNSRNILVPSAASVYIQKFITVMSDYFQSHRNPGTRTS